MTAKTGMARKIARARGLFGEVTRLAEVGKRDADDVSALNLVLQALKDGHLYEVRVTPRLTERQLARARRIIPPPGGGIHLITVPVDESRPWSEAVLAAGPNTSPELDIWEFGGQYPLVAGAARQSREVILVHFGSGSYTLNRHALAWGKVRRLSPASPRTVLAIGEHFPNLNRDLAMKFMAVVLLERHSFGLQRTLSVWWHGSRRDAGLSRCTLDWGNVGWFAFVREEAAE